MAVPTEIDWILVKMGDGADPEVFTLLCGIADVDINETVNTNDRARRDCAKPGETPFRYTRSSSQQMDVSGSGITDVDAIATLGAALGKVKNYRLEAYQEDGTDAGALLGTYAGAFRLTSNTTSASRDGDSSKTIALASHGRWTYTAAP